MPQDFTRNTNDKAVWNDSDVIAIQSTKTNGDVVWEKTTVLSLKAQLALGQTTTKTLEIGDWSIPGNRFTNVLHGLSATEWKTIRAVNVIVRSDADTKYVPLASISAYAGVIDGGVTYIDSSGIQISRTDGGEFDNVAYSTTSFNRGWITIEYTKD
jgi:hypothetical protein